MHIGYALCDGFLHPFVHLVLILIEPIATEDIATSKRGWSRFASVLTYCRVICTKRIPPGGFESVGRIVYPLWARNLMEATEIFDGCRDFPLCNPLHYLIVLHI